MSIDVELQTNNALLFDSEPLLEPSDHAMRAELDMPEKKATALRKTNQTRAMNLNPYLHERLLYFIELEAIYGN